jgi:hypothetical protein
VFEIAPQRDRETPCERHDTDAPQPPAGGPKRWLKQWLSWLLGWKRNQLHANGAISHRARFLPALLMPVRLRWYRWHTVWASGPGQPATSPDARSWATAEGGAATLGSHAQPAGHARLLG